jgi:hypothetical protein
MDFWQASQDDRGTRSRLRAGLGLFTLVAALALGAAPAGAILYRLHNGHNVSYEKIVGKPAPSNITPSNAARSSALSVTPSHGEIFGTTGYLNYSGGPVMPSSQNFVVNWDPGTFGPPQPFPNGNAYGTGSSCGNGSGGSFTTPCSGYVDGVHSFFQDLQAATAANQPTTNQVATQYVANGGAPNYSSSSGGAVLTDTAPYPASGCPAAPSGGICLTDTQVQNELQRFLAANGEPNGATNEYFLLTPPGVAMCFDTGGQECSANAGPGGKGVFCAYHSRTATSSQYIYSNIPDMDNITGCDPFVTGSSGGGSPCDFQTCIWPNGWADGVLSAVSHELNESITDPEPNNAWADWGQAHNKPGEENGDKCNADAGDDPSTVYHDNGDFSVTPSNQTIGTRRYWVQMQWSNQNLSCLNHYTASGTAPTSSFSVASSGTSANFTASPGAAQYVWQFNDDVAPGDSPQQFTVTTTSPTISHTFPQLGTYTVALTAMSGTGLSQASSQNVTLTNPPPPPTNTFNFGKPKLNKKNGTAKLPVTVPGAGTLTLSGKGLKPITKAKVGRKAVGPGTTKLLVKAVGKAAKKLKINGKLRVAPKITFTPTGGTPKIETKRLKLIRKR